MSVRNIDADLAASKLNELFHLHRYDDCVLFINRLSPLALLHLLPNLPIDAYLSRLPYTIELFESLYAKVFIHDPEQFPVRTLQPERLIDKMVAYFSLLNVNPSGKEDNELEASVFLEPIDGAKMLDSFENVIRVISYVQPQQYSRLLYFKYAIDRALLRFERDLVSFGRNMATLNEYLLVHQTSAASGFHKGTMKKSRSMGNNYANALLISRASNLQTCESMRVELEKSIANCQKAHLKLNDYITHLKSQKLSKNLQSIVFGTTNLRELSPDGTENTNTVQPVQSSSKSSTLKKNNKESKEKERKASASTERANESSKSKKGATSAAARSESVSNFRQQSVSGSAGEKTPALATDVNSNVPINGFSTLPHNLKKSQSSIISIATICQDFIQNRLYLNKAMMNSIEPYLDSIKLQQLLNSLYEKIDLDKEILLVYTHIKREESYLSSLEPLQPLFKRYSLGFERCIQVWRKKCSADSLLLCNNLDPILSLPDQYLVSSAQSPTTTAQPASATLGQPVERFSKSMANDDSIFSIANNLNISSLSPSRNAKKHNQQLAAAALSAAASSSIAAAMASSLQNGSSAQTAVVNSNISINYSNANANNDEEAESETTIKHQKYFSEVNLFSSPVPNKYSCATMPAKLKAPKKLDLENGQEGSLSNSNSRTLVVLTKNADVQTELESVEVPATKIDPTLSIELEKVNVELSKAKETIAKLKDENEKLKEAEKVEKPAQIEVEKEEPKKLSNKATSGEQEFQNYQYTYDLIYLYNNLNHKYRTEAFDALELADSGTQNVYEFKIKLLFSVIVLSYRYVKNYVRDLKRRVKSVLQIHERSPSAERTASQKSQTPQTPTIVIQRAEESSPNHPSLKHATTDGEPKKRPSLGIIGRFASLRVSSVENEHHASIKSIENALDYYLQASALTNSFDLIKIVEEVKQQLWTTLSEYPQLKECQELNSFIGESVKTSWVLVNHQPVFKIDYSTNKYNPQLHERSEASNTSSEQILNYVWPALIDSSDNSCLSKGIVIT